MARLTGPKHGVKMLKMNNSSNCFLGSQKYAEYGKISEKNRSPKFRPLDPWDWPKTWCKNGKNEKNLQIS